MATESPESNKPTGEKRQFDPWIWVPLAAGSGSLGLLLLTYFTRKIDLLTWPAVACVGATLLYFLIQCVARLVKRKWRGALFAFLSLSVC